MSKKTIWALSLLVFVMVVLVINRSGSASVDLILGEVHLYKSLVYLAFTVVGIVIGLLLGK